ncbi:MAG: glycosyltransferase [Synergistaceae bacterium]|jgi:glycosyltransferase involved in cell wall biosynthesis|nr:glycosyltransferase [Synergistaceae bacterium]
MCTISVIVPVYNVEKYLPKCIESILTQTYENFELILVADEGPDRSSEICDEYAAKDKRIKVLHRPKGDLSGARNDGIEQAKGKYIMFVDADDFTRQDFMHHLLCLAKKYNADLVITRSIIIYENGRIRNIDPGLKEGIYSKQEIYRHFLLRLINVGAWACLYKRNLFEKIRYPIGELAEDMAISHELIESADVIVFGEEKGYYYFQRKEGSLRFTLQEKHFLVLDRVKKLFDFISLNYPDLEKIALRYYIDQYFTVLNKAIFSNQFKIKIDVLKQEILKHRRVILSDACFNKKHRLAVLLLGLGMPVYKSMWNLYLLWDWKWR